jgi:hypothetical protein
MKLSNLVIPVIVTGGLILGVSACGGSPASTSSICSTVYNDGQPTGASVSAAANEASPRTQLGQDLASWNVNVTVGNGQDTMISTGVSQICSAAGWTP